MRKRKNIYIPTEIYKREYPGRAFLTAEALRRGYRIFLGSKQSIANYIEETREEGIYFYKGAGVKNKKRRNLLRKNNCKVIAQFEETSFVRESFSDWFALNSGLLEADNIDQFFCWGSEEYESLKREFQKIGRSDAILYKTGSPRTVVWGAPGKAFFSNEVQALKEKYGGYVLILTNFGAANFYSGFQSLINLNKSLGSHTEERFLDLCKLFNEEKLKINLFSEAIKKINYETNMSVIIRPHPVENPQTWRGLIKDLENVYVIPKGPVTPLIIGASHIVHDGCTTGVEAAALEKNPIALAPKGLGNPKYFPNRVSRQSSNAEELLSLMIKPIIAPSNDQVTQLLSKKLDSWGETTPAVNIMNTIDKLDVKGYVGCSANRKWVIDYALRKARGFLLHPKTCRLSRKKLEGFKAENVFNDIEAALATSGIDVTLQTGVLSADLFFVEAV